MAVWHLDELRSALERKGWRVVTELPGDDYSISAGWEIQRSGDPRKPVIEFCGFDDMQCLPLDQSYACQIRDTKVSLSFSRRGETGSPARTRWRSELNSFVESINDLSQQW